MWGEVQRAAGAMERLVELLHAEPSIVAPADPVPLPAPGARRDPLRARDASAIRRGPDTPALDDFDLAVRPGETVAFVGPVGRRQDHHLPAAAALLRPAVAAASCSTACDIASADPQACGGASALVPQEHGAVRGDARARTSATAGPTRPTPRSRPRRARPRPTSSSRSLPRGLRHLPRRARRAAVGRPAAAHRHRPRDPARSADPAARRGDQRARRRERAAGAGGARAPDAGPHDARHRPPPRHRAGGRPHRGDGPGPHRRRRAPTTSWCAATSCTPGSPRCSSRPPEAATMTPRVNELGLPIGAEVPGWTPRRPPPRAAMEGRYCRVEPLDPARHAARTVRGRTRSTATGACGPTCPTARSHASTSTARGSRRSMPSATIRSSSRSSTAARGAPSGVASYLRIDPAQRLDRGRAPAATRRACSARPPPPRRCT